MLARALVIRISPIANGLHFFDVSNLPYLLDNSVSRYRRVLNFISPLGLDMFASFMAPI